jgi:hypothetical protein
MKNYLFAWDTVVVAAVIACATCAPCAEAQGPQSDGKRVLIRLDEGKRLSVVCVQQPALNMGAESKGMLIWTDGDREAWQGIGPGVKWVHRPIDSGEGDLRSALHASRTQNAGASGEPAVMMTAMVDQILSLGKFRNGPFLTPHKNGKILNPRISLRRSPVNGKFPAVVATLKKGNKNNQIGMVLPVGCIEVRAIGGIRPYRV